jgi:hypothetical protein
MDGKTSLRSVLLLVAILAGCGNSQFSIAVKDHVYQAFKPYPDGSAAYPAAGSDSKSVAVARVMPCQ